MQSQPFKRWFFLKYRSINFYINSTWVTRLELKQVEFLQYWNKEAITCTDVLQGRFKFRNQFWFLSQIRCMITLRLGINTISIRVSHRCWEHGGLFKIQRWVTWARGLKTLFLKLCKIYEKYLWRSSFVTKVAGYKPGNLQLY